MLKKQGDEQATDAAIAIEMRKLQISSTSASGAVSFSASKVSRSMGVACVPSSCDESTASLRTKAYKNQSRDGTISAAWATTGG